MGKIFAMNMQKIQYYPSNILSFASSMQIIKMDKFIKHKIQPIYKYMERYSNADMQTH